MTQTACPSLSASAPNTRGGRLIDFLNDSRPDSDLGWRAWAQRLLARGVHEADLVEIWLQIVAFDDVLAGYIAQPIPVPAGTVTVSGSGKESFKTFNVSTAAAILAAAAGAPVVKGVSGSVSAVSGSADVLSFLGIPTARPEQITEQVERHGVAFAEYGAFCPRYAARYDDRFLDLNPMSFIMPAATLAVTASGFVHGLAHADVHVAARAIAAARPERGCGSVVTSRIQGHERIDELADRGTVTEARLGADVLVVQQDTLPSPTPSWRHVVRHRDDHVGNAKAVIDALAPDGDPFAAGLVEVNAALIVATSRPEISRGEARFAVRQARLSGAALTLVERLRSLGGGRTA